MTKLFTITDDELTQLGQLKDVLLSCLNREYKDVCIIKVDRIDMLRNYSLLSEIIRHIKFRADSPGITPEAWDYIKNADDQPYLHAELIREILTHNDISLLGPITEKDVKK